MTMYLHLPFVSIPIPINPPHPSTAAGAGAGRAATARTGAVGTWRIGLGARRLGIKGMNREEMVWATTVVSDLIPTTSIG
ncbi:hypothetical protein MMRN_05530 [Mycobacterium marinum]|nr:hypothetical protein MMRN_05530 [Mycobacterium marinum]